MKNFITGYFILNKLFSSPAFLMLKQILITSRVILAEKEYCLCGGFVVSLEGKRLTEAST